MCMRFTKCKNVKFSLTYGMYNLNVFRKIIQKILFSNYIKLSKKSNHTSLDHVILLK